MSSSDIYLSASSSSSSSSSSSIQRPAAPPPCMQASIIWYFSPTLKLLTSLFSRAFRSSGSFSQRAQNCSSIALCYYSSVMDSPPSSEPMPANSPSLSDNFFPFSFPFLFEPNPRSNSSSSLSTPFWTLPPFAILSFEVSKRSLFLCGSSSSSSITLSSFPSPFFRPIEASKPPFSLLVERT